MTQNRTKIGTCPYHDFLIGMGALFLNLGSHVKVKLSFSRAYYISDFLDGGIHTKVGTRAYYKTFE
jgi:hypothetical protein